MTQPQPPPRTEPPNAGSELGRGAARHLLRQRGGRSLPPAESWFDGSSPRPPPPPRTDGFSVAGFVLGVVGVVPLSIPLGIVGLRRTRRDGRRGRNLAVAGLTVSGCWLAIFAVLAAFMIAGGREARPGEAIPVADLRVNQCFDADLDQGSLLVVRIADCAAPHAGEAYDRVDARLTGLRSEDKQAAATQACATSFEQFVGRRYEDSKLDMYYVVLEDHAVADGNVLCMVGSAGDRLSGSMRGTRR
jgi:hypothetical protein